VKGREIEDTGLKNESEVRVLSFAKGIETDVAGDDEKQTGTGASGERSYAPFRYVRKQSTTN